MSVIDTADLRLIRALDNNPELEDSLIHCIRTAIHSYCTPLTTRDDIAAMLNWLADHVEAH